MGAQFAVADHYLCSVHLERPSAENTDDDRVGILEMLAAVDALTSGWLVPLGVDLLFVQCDPANYFEQVGEPIRSAHFLRAATVPSGVRVGATFTKSKDEEVSAIDASVIRKAVLQGIEQPVPPGLVNSLSMMRWTSVRARSPIDDTIDLLTPDPVRPITEMIDGSRWYFGPEAGSVVGPPALLQCINAHFSTELLLQVKWDLWAGYPPGRAMIDAGIARVLARPGWEVRRVTPPP